MTNISTQRGFISRLFRRAPSEQKNVPYWYSGFRSYVTSAGKPVWSGRSYGKFAEEAYCRNVVAHRAIAMISRNAAAITVLAFSKDASGNRKEEETHPILSLLASPNPVQSQGAFFEALYTYKLLAGNAFVQAVAPVGEPPRELYLLRPDRVEVIAGKGSIPQGYRYTVGDGSIDFGMDRISGFSPILHLKDFHPTNDWYGLSSVEAAAYSIDQHNQASAWNQSLLQNGARPSGALVVRTAEGVGGLSEEQYWRLKEQVNNEFTSPENAGKPILLEGGMEWKEMSLSPKDMDFLEAKHSSARDIALAFGVPPQLLGIPGDNTYSNLSEARMALWEQTILPLVDVTLGAFSSWLSWYYGEKLFLEADTDTISALALRREKVWERIKDVTFLTDDEKRAAVGYGRRT